jgi:hypothetical protein
LSILGTLFVNMQPNGGTAQFDVPEVVALTEYKNGTAPESSSPALVFLGNRQVTGSRKDSPGPGRAQFDSLG